MSVSMIDTANDILKDVVIHNVKVNNQKFIKVLQIINYKNSDVPDYKVESSNSDGFKLISQAEAKIVTRILGINFINTKPNEVVNHG